MGKLLLVLSLARKKIFGELHLRTNKLVGGLNLSFRCELLAIICWKHTLDLIGLAKAGEVFVIHGILVWSKWESNDLLSNLEFKFLFIYKKECAKKLSPL